MTWICYFWGTKSTPKISESCQLCSPVGFVFPHGQSNAAVWVASGSPSSAQEEAAVSHMIFWVYLSFFLQKVGSGKRAALRFMCCCVCITFGQELVTGAWPWSRLRYWASWCSSITFLLLTSPPAYGKYHWEKGMGLELMYSFDYLIISSFKSNLNTEIKLEQEGKHWELQVTPLWGISRCCQVLPLYVGHSPLFCLNHCWSVGSKAGFGTGFPISDRNPLWVQQLELLSISVWLEFTCFCWSTTLSGMVCWAKVTWLQNRCASLGAKQMMVWQTCARRENFPHTPICCE